MPGPEGKSFPLCPYCYNSPPFEGVDRLFDSTKARGKSQKGSGMPCFLCPHPTCRHSLITQGVCACPECSGTLVLDPISAPNWKLFCNMCNCLVFLPQGAHRISTTRDQCPDCDSKIIEVDFNKKTSPLADGATLHSGCILCDELLHSLVLVKHGRMFSRRGVHGRGRGSGRGRGAGKMVDPKMSFRGFWNLVVDSFQWACHLLVPSMKVVITNYGLLDGVIGNQRYACGTIWSVFFPKYAVWLIHQIMRSLPHSRLRLTHQLINGVAASLWPPRCNLKSFQITLSHLNHLAAHLETR